MVLGESWKIIEMEVLILIVDSPFPYHTTIVRTMINPNNIVTSTAHPKLKFPSPNGISEVLVIKSCMSSATQIISTRVTKGKPLSSRKRQAHGRTDFAPH